MGGFAIFERNFRFGTLSRAYRMPPLSSTQRFCPRAGTIDTMRKGQVLRNGIIGMWPESLPEAEKADNPVYQAVALGNSGSWYVSSWVSRRRCPFTQT
jgi:hypothetical protein